MALHYSEKKALHGFLRCFKKVQKLEREKGCMHMISFYKAKMSAYQEVLTLAPHKLYFRTLSLECFPDVKVLP